MLPKLEVDKKYSVEDLVAAGVLEVGEGTKIDEDVWLCHDARGVISKTTIGKNCRIRSGTVIYSNVTIGDNCNFGQHSVVRENCRIGNNTSIGTHVTVENDTTIGSYTSIETCCHVTAFATIGDYVFLGADVITNNDFSMKYRREGHGTKLIGPTIKKGARIGSGAIIMAGVQIGEHSIINSGERVRKNIDDCILYFTKGNKPVYKKIKKDLVE